MPNRDIIVIGASAGGVEALIHLVHDLPSDLGAAIFITVHIPPFSKSVLPDILSRVGVLPAIHPQNEEEIRPGRIYVAAPDHHLIVKQGFVYLMRSPKEHRHRPAIDALFRSAAQAYGQRVVGVVLSGMLDDGTAGLAAVKDNGGIAIVQDPEEALFNSMPQSAIAHVAVDYILPVADMAKVIQQIIAVSESTMAFNQNVAEFPIGLRGGDGWRPT